MNAKFLITPLTLVMAVAAKNATEKPESYNIFGPEVNPDGMSCDPKGQIFLLLPHFSDCNKFFMCAHGEEVEFKCAGNTIFDFHGQHCQWPSLARCTLRTRDFEGSGDEVSDNMIGLFSHVLEQQPVDTMASVRPISPLLSRFNGIINCNRADEAARRVAYRGDCQRYWKCVGGIPQAAYCTDGLFFNESNQQCDFEGNSKCDSTLPQDELQAEFIVYKKCWLDVISDDMLANSLIIKAAEDHPKRWKK